METSGARGVEASEKKTEVRRVRASDAVSSSLESKLRILGDAITELDTDILDREVLSLALGREMDREISDLEFELKEVKHRTLGGIETMEARRLALEREVLALKHEKRGEYVRAWADISALRRKRREFVMEFDNLMRTVSALW
ncbi:MAG: hypothetical protein AB1512_02705 [Thermodesulfobacteriota bacterium]